TSGRLLRESVAAYEGGDVRRAQELAASSYLDGFELAEASLDARDRSLRLAVESAMTRYRAMLREGVPVAAARAQAARIQELLGQAQARMDGAGVSAAAAFGGAFAILFREGLEAVLVIAGLIAVLSRAGRRTALRWVHAGWILALALGALTWLAASYVISI